MTIQRMEHVGIVVDDLAARHGGRPPKMTIAKFRQAQRMRAEGTSITEVAAVLYVSRATIHRHLQPSTQSGDR